MEENVKGQLKTATASSTRASEIRCKRGSRGRDQVAEEVAVNMSRTRQKTEEES